MMQNNKANMAHIEQNTTQLRGGWFEGIFQKITLLNALLVLTSIFGVLLSLVYSSLETFQTQGVAFLWTNVWDTVDNHYGALGPVVGTLITSAIAIILALPVSVGIAIFLTELAPVWIRRPLAIAIDLLAAIPSIIY